ARESADHPSRSSRWSLSVGEEAGRTLTGPVPTGRIPLDRLQRTYGMARTLRVVFRRDPDKDRSREQIQYEGYQVLWPDGRPVAIAFDAFCRHGQRLLGLGRHLQGCTERLVDLMFFPLKDRDDDLVRI